MRTISAVYIFAFLSLLTHVQLNLLGRFNYLYSVISLTERDREQTIQIQHPTGSTISALTETKYLTFSWWLLHVSWRSLVESVNFAVQSVLAEYALSESFVSCQFLGFRQLRDLCYLLVIECQ